jgi:hypothetical protein
MSYVQRQTVKLTTDASGAATGYTANVTGSVSAIRYVKTDFADGSTFTVTNETTGETIWTQTGVNASATVAPRQAVHSTAGVADLFAAAGTAVPDRIALANDRISIVISAGGNTKTGTFYFTLD